MENYEVLTDDQKEFIKLHREIEACNINVGIALYERNMKLREMHERKLYLSYGYSSFEDYTTTALNMKKSQAYACINIPFSREFFEEHGKIGITKIKMLVNLEEEEASQFIYNHDVDNISVKQLQKEIKKLTEQEKEESIPAEPVEIQDDSKDTDLKAALRCVYDSFGQFLRLHRIKLELSTKEMAEALLVSRSFYMNVEAGRRIASNALFYQQLSKTLKLSSDEIQVMNELVDKYYAASSRISRELSEFIATDSNMLKLVRTVKSGNIPDYTWNQIFKLLNH